MKKKLIALALVLMFMGLAACGQKEPAGPLAETRPPQAPGASGAIAPLQAVTLPEAIPFENYEARSVQRKENPVDADLLAALNGFAYESAAQIIGRDSQNGKSACYSPLSLYFALAIAATGAAGETQTELFSLLGAADAQSLSAKCGSFFRALYADNNAVKLRLADSLWIDDSFEPEAAFVQNAAEHFYADTFRADLASREAMDAMAAWINERTAGLLEPSFEPDPRTLLCILNTIYFKGAWEAPFDEQNTIEETFYRADGTEVPRAFMHATFTNQGYLKGEGYAKTSLRLADGSRMVLILPDEGKSVADFLASKALAAAIEAEEEGFGEVKVALPQFDHFSDLELTDALRNMGVIEAFRPEADFSGIVGAGDECFIGQVLHQCRVRVNEEGLEAAAYTAIIMRALGALQGSAEIAFDRPFLYALVDQSGAVLFLGVCMDPAA